MDMGREVQPFFQVFLGPFMQSVKDILLARRLQILHGIPPVQGSAELSYITGRG
jgi:hypothetical protein